MIEKIPLDERVKGGAGLNFISVKIPIEPDRYIPFVLVEYSISEKPQDKHLRLDLDKQTFADHFDNQDWESILRRASGQIAQIVAEFMRRATYQRLRKEFAG